MNELIPIKAACIGGEEINAVNARDLYAALGIKKDFSTWVKAQIERAGFVEGIDYIKIAEKSSSPKKGSGIQSRIDYFVTIQAAKEICMMAQTPKGKEVRLYFIECERKLKEVQAIQIPQSLPEALRLAANLAEQKMQLEAQIKEDAPKVEYANTVDGRGKGIIIDLVAKKLNVKPQWLRQFLRNEVHWLRHDGAPMQWAVNQEYVTYKDWIIPHNSGIQEIKTTTYITGKGEIRLAQLIYEYREKQATGGLFEEQAA